MEISKEREYVLVSVKWSKEEGYLMFWGTQTPDDAARRSYGGYTMDLETCEKYTFAEATKRSDCPEWKGQSFHQLKKENSDGTWAVKISDLHHFGTKKTIIWL